MARPGLEESGYLLVTLHRAENTDDPARLASIIGAMEELSRYCPEVFPTHPRTRSTRPGLVYRYT